MQLFFKRLLIIAKKILSDVHFSTQKEFEEYLKNHPGYRENTRFYVNGVQVKAPPKQKKKPSTSQRSTEELVKTYGKLGETTLEYCFDSLFRTAISKKLDLNGFYKRNEKTILNIVNGFIKDSGYKKGLTSKEAESLFEYFLSKRKKEEEPKKEEPKKEEPKKEEPEKEEPKKEEEKIMEILEEISNERKNKKDEEIKSEIQKKRERYYERFKIKYPNLSEEKLEELVSERIDDNVLYKNFDAFEVASASPSLPGYYGVDKKRYDYILDFEEAYKETNEKLKSNGLPEISRDKFREKFNEARFPLFQIKFEKIMSREDFEEKIKNLRSFIGEHIAQNIDFFATDFQHISTIVNTLQKMKREFPDLFKFKLEFFNCAKNSDNYAAHIARRGGEFAFFKNVFFMGERRINRYQDEKGNEYVLGRSYRGSLSENRPINYISSKKYIETVTTHEFAHLVKEYFHAFNGGSTAEDSGKKIYNGKPIYVKLSTSEKIKKIEKDIEDLYNESMDNGDIYKLTWYASTEPEEFWAEIFAIYYDDKSLLPPNILTKLEEIINDLKS